MKQTKKDQELSPRDRLKSEMEYLRKKFGLMPEPMLDWAKKNPKSALHARLEWNDTEAGRAYRIWQIRDLMIHVLVEKSPVDGVFRRIYVSPMQMRGDKGGYQPLIEVLGREDLREMFLAQALDELERVCSRYTDLCELAGVRAAVRLVRQKGSSKAA